MDAPDAPTGPPEALMTNPTEVAARLAALAEQLPVALRDEDGADDFDGDFAAILGALARTAAAVRETVSMCQGSIDQMAEVEDDPYDWASACLEELYFGALDGLAGELRQAAEHTGRGQDELAVGIAADLTASA